MTGSLFGKSIHALVIACSFLVLTALTDRGASAQSACTQEAKLCADGSAVGRTEPGCQFAACPSPPSLKPNSRLACTSDSACPSSIYACEVIEGRGTACPANAHNCVPTFTITKGICKVTVGSACGASADCATGLICHGAVCTSPIGVKCDGKGDASCPGGYQCIQDCGPPVARPGDPPPPYSCLLNEVANRPRMCPICLASNTRIATPAGDINVKDVKVGTIVWSQNNKGEKIAREVIRISRTPVPPTHQVLHLVMSDGREVWASPGHPAADGRALSRLTVGDPYDGAQIQKAEAVPYGDKDTFDILPSGETGLYRANDILLGSTLKSSLN